MWWWQRTSQLVPRHARVLRTHRTNVNVASSMVQIGVANATVLHIDQNVARAQGAPLQQHGLKIAASVHTGHAHRIDARARGFSVRATSICCRRACWTCCADLDRLTEQRLLPSAAAFLAPPCELTGQFCPRHSARREETTSSSSSGPSVRPAACPPQALRKRPGASSPQLHKSWWEFLVDARMHECRATNFGGGDLSFSKAEV